MVWEVGSGIFKNLGDIVMAFAEDVLETLQNLGCAITDWIASGFSAEFDWKKNKDRLSDAFSNANIYGKASEQYDAVTNKWDGIENSLDDTLGKKIHDAFTQDTGELTWFAKLKEVFSPIENSIKGSTSGGGLAWGKTPGEPELAKNVDPRFAGIAVKDSVDAYKSALNQQMMNNTDKTEEYTHETADNTEKIATEMSTLSSAITSFLGGENGIETYALST